MSTDAKYRGSNIRLEFVEQIFIAIVGSKYFKPTLSMRFSLFVILLRGSTTSECTSFSNLLALKWLFLGIGVEEFFYDTFVTWELRFSFELIAALLITL
eukprot:IDg16831t1